MKSVAVLGCGPSGLMVAHAAAMLGWNFRVYSKKKERSNLRGTQFLHKPIPGMTGGPATIIRQHIEGSIEDVETKMYGAPTGLVSPDDWSYEYAWDMRATYEKMYAAYEQEIEVHTLRPNRMNWRWGDMHDLVISTIPRNLWGKPGDSFLSAKIWVYDDQENPMFSPKDSNIILDGTKEVGWFRASNVFGHRAIEWPENTKPPISGLSLVEIPLGHNSTSASDFVHLGKYGAWEKDVLSTNVFEQAMQILSQDRM